MVDSDRRPLHRTSLNRVWPALAFLASGNEPASLEDRRNGLDPYVYRHPVQRGLPLPLAPRSTLPLEILDLKEDHGSARPLDRGEGGLYVVSASCVQGLLRATQVWFDVPADGIAYLPQPHVARWTGSKPRPLTDGHHKRASLSNILAESLVQPCLNAMVPCCGCPRRSRRAHAAALAEASRQSTPHSMARAGS